MKLFKQLALVGLFAASCSAHAISVISPFVHYNGHDYIKLSADNWSNSEAFAISLGGHLVAVNDAAENSFLISQFGTVDALWLGFYRTTPGGSTFAWSNGDAVTFTNWAAYEPNNSGGDEDYTHTYAAGDWNDVSDNSYWPGDKFGVVEIVSRSVPEPSLFLMALTGLGLLGVVRRRSVK